MNKLAPALGNTATQPCLSDAVKTALGCIVPGANSAISMPPDALLLAAMGARNTSDAPLLSLCHGLDLSQSVLIAICLAMDLEQDPQVATWLRQIQGETFGAWPAVATLAQLLPHLGIVSTTPLPDLSVAYDLGILTRVGDRAPGPEDRFALTPPVLQALGLPSVECGVTPLPSQTPLLTWTAKADDLADRIADGTCIVLRQGDRGDRMDFAATIAAALGRTAMNISAAHKGAGVAAQLGRWLPVSVIETTLGTRSMLPPLQGYTGIRIAVINTDGGLRTDSDWQCVDVALPSPAPSPDPLWRMGPTRTRAVQTRIDLQPHQNTSLYRQRAALGDEFRAEMEPHAQLVPDWIEPQDFVADAETSRNLDVLTSRCRFLLSGQSTRIKGVKALLSGPSGTGKTLAASFLSTTLGLPLFKLDLSAVVSKYIGETEENLAAILDHAESGHLVLLMDEADSLFAGRTDVTDSSSRFANNQSNFLLTRFESFGGIALLTSNTPERFDTAFARRLDQVIAIHPPAAPQRRELLRRNLGQDHGLTSGEINRIAGLIDLTGGHIRNIVHTARVLACEADVALDLGHMRIGINQEYQKLGRQAPSEFAR